MIWLSSPLAPCVSRRSLGELGVATLSEVKRRQTGMSQPAQEPRPTVLVWSRINAPTMYSVVGSRWTGLAADTAAAQKPTALPGPASPRWYPVLGKPPASAPPPQSTQLPTGSTGDATKPSAFPLQLPVFLNSHHAGNVGPVDLRENRISIPVTRGMAVSS